MGASPRCGRRSRIGTPCHRPAGHDGPHYASFTEAPAPVDRRPNYVADPEAIDAVARAWADAGPVPRVHRAAQKDLRRLFPLLAKALDRLTGERP